MAEIALTMRQVVILATKNMGKAREISALLSQDIEVQTLQDIDVESPEETGDTFAANAAIKATEISKIVGRIVLADDSGLEVDALGGAPGVRSARFAGEPPDDGRNISLLLRRLEAVESDRRSARFVCAVAVARNGQVLFTSEGRCEGHIGRERKGSNGFGYDPVFILNSGQTMAEITNEEKNRISHRAMAFRNVAEHLHALLNEWCPLENINDDRAPGKRKAFFS
jgi:XTP/dITP diphosphohydrolase